MTDFVLSGAVTNPSGSLVTSLGSFTMAQLNAAVSDGDVVYLGSADTIGGAKIFSAGVTVTDNVFTVLDNTDPTKSFKFQAGSISAGQSRTITIPDAAGTIALIDAALTVSANWTIPDANLIIVDDGDATKRLKFQLSSITTGQTRNMTIPDADGTLATLGGVAQTFTNTMTVNANFTGGNLTGTTTCALGVGATANGSTKTVNIGTAGVSGSTTNVTIGSSVAGAIVTISHYGTNVFLSPIAFGYGTGAGGAVTQGTSRVTGVTLNTPCGQITMFSAAGSAVWSSFVLTNSQIAIGDVILISYQTATNDYLFSTKALAGSCKINFATTAGVATDAPILNFVVIKAVAS